ncbi:MAG: hypothetical protein GY702_28640 [Desulfobulbaceae bacterium]|nr:hypothetical protein [Desulfobulbaceae bacterium]
MSNISGLALYLLAGLIGGFIGYRLKITGGTLIGAMCAVIVINLLLGRNFKIPITYTFITQVLIGVMVGASFSKELARTLLPLLLPVFLSTLVLVSAGTIVSLILVRMGILDAHTAFFSTSPGAMGVLLGLAGDTSADLPIVLSFHIFRIFFIIFTAPLAYRFLQNWLAP